jgi:hypothetical protein
VHDQNFNPTKVIIDEFLENYRTPKPPVELSKEDQEIVDQLSEVINED